MELQQCSLKEIRIGEKKEEERKPETERVTYISIDQNVPQLCGGLGDTTDCGGPFVLLGFDLFYCTMARDSRVGELGLS